MTSVTGETLGSAAQSEFETGPSILRNDDTMTWPKLPSGQQKPAWGAMFGAIPMAWIFLDPYQRHAHWLEWIITSLAYVTFLALCALGAIYWSRHRVVAYVCAAMTALAVSFTAYRPSGVVFFVYVVAYSPWAVRGQVARSAAIITGVVAVLAIEWMALWPPDTLPWVIGIACLLVGTGTTFSARQQIALARANRVAERERIARDMHDILGHTLSVVILKSELAGRLLEHDPQRAQAEIGDVERISRKALADVREAISGYRAGDLKEELERAKSTLETAGIAVDGRWDDFGMPAAHERALALVVREAVTNVVRHAHAKNCRLTLERSNGAYRLEVRDDGRGGSHREGLGMRGIRERVAALGGTASWSGQAGTELTVAVPVVSEIAGEGND
jgi:two-component system sensor histidine kinase DesK